MKKLFLILLTSICNFTLAQQSSAIESIQADRPDQTETPYLVPRGMFQVESGFTFEKSRNTEETCDLPSVLWKYGVNTNFELRLITEFVIEKSVDEQKYGFNPIAIGCKIKVADEVGIFPKVSFIGHVNLPKLASEQFKTDYFAPDFRFTMQHTLSQKMTLSYNLGAEWDGFSPQPTFIYTLTSGYTLTTKWGCYTELFGFAPQNSNASHNFDGGFTYLLNANTMLDFSAGLGLTHNSFQHYIAVGFSLRK